MGFYEVLVPSVESLLHSRHSVCWLGMFNEMFISISILVSGLCMAYQKFFYILCCYCPSTEHGLRYLNSYSYSYMG
jgi:hypothetical protein